jgi:hypothetical protein
MPAIAALAGIGAVGRSGNQANPAMRIAARFMVGADDEQAGVFALRPGVGLQRNAGEAGAFGQPVFQVLEQHLVAARLRQRRKGMQPRRTPARISANISAAAFSFIVHEPSGIIEAVSERSRDSSRLM